MEGIQSFDELVNQHVAQSLASTPLGFRGRDAVLQFMRERYEGLKKFGHHRLSQQAIEKANDVFSGTLRSVNRRTREHALENSVVEHIVMVAADVFVSMLFLLPGESC